MKILFIPDIFKEDEMFILEGNTETEIFQKLDEEMSCNTICSAFSFTTLGLNLIGFIKLEEGNPPKLIDIKEIKRDGRTT